MQRVLSLTLRIALGVSYRGSGYQGWQSQPSGLSVQDALERALSQVADAPVRVVAAGRTDAGVHATGQVVHFDTAAVRPSSAWVRGTNAHLPSGVVVSWSRPMDETFHARFSACARTYQYLLYNDPVRPALLADLSGWFHRPLDVTAMREAARPLLGRHDFSSFRSSQCQARSPEREVTSLAIDIDGPYLIFTLSGSMISVHFGRPNVRRNPRCGICAGWIYGRAGVISCLNWLQMPSCIIWSETSLVPWWMSVPAACRRRP